LQLIWALKEANLSELINNKLNLSTTMKFASVVVALLGLTQATNLESHAHTKSMVLDHEPSDKAGDDNLS